MSTFLTRVVLKNYKSIAFCDVALGDLVFLVGPNGAGKSNFVDALRLVSDALNTSLDHALRDRSGIKEVRRRSGGHPRHFEIRLEFQFAAGGSGFYTFRVGAKERGGFTVQREECRVSSDTGPNREASFRVESGIVKSVSLENPPPSSDDWLFLQKLAGWDQFRPLYHALSRMGFYNLNPDVIRREQPPDVGRVLKRDGSNLASVLRALQTSAPEAKQRVEEFLAAVVPGLEGVGVREVLSKETVEFRQQMQGSENAWRFLAANMSDGTLRVLGILVALFQGAFTADYSIPLIGIEEPESALHPGAAGVLRDALRIASQHTQVVVTTHSPDLLDDKEISADALLVVTNENGKTTIAPVDETSRSLIRDHLDTAGELLRLDQLEPYDAQVRLPEDQRSSLFGDLER